MCAFAVFSGLPVPQGGLGHVGRVFLVFRAVGGAERADRRGQKRRQREIRMSRENGHRIVADPDVQYRSDRKR